jgi:hypothetical protein
MSRADSPNVAASISSANSGTNGDIVAPARYPPTCAAWPALLLRARPTTSRSPVSMSGIRADFAACAGGFAREVRNSSRSMPSTGMPGTATSAIVDIRSRSQTIITRRYRCRSASVDSSGPPITQGRKLRANVAAERPTDRVRSYTRAVTAALAR